jgi:hypothetical protein
MIKKYNQFIKRINEAGEEQAPVVTPTPTTTPAPAIDPAETPDKRRERYTIKKPSVDPDPLAYGEGVEDSLEYLNDTLEGSELMNNILKYQGHEITLPSETEQFEVDGVRRIKREGNKLVPTSSSEDVIEYLNNPEAQSEAQGAQSRRSQAQAQRGSQAQVQAQMGAQAQYENFETQDDDDDDFGFESPFCKPCEGKGCEECDGSGMKRNSIFPDSKEVDEDEFETQTGKDPESEALSGEKVDVQETGRKRQAQFESKSYKSRFRTKF